MPTESAHSFWLNQGAGGYSGRLKASCDQWAHPPQTTQNRDLTIALTVRGVLLFWAVALLLGTVAASWVGDTIV